MVDVDAPLQQYFRTKKYYVEKWRHTIKDRAAEERELADLLAQTRIEVKQKTEARAEQIQQELRLKAENEKLIEMRRFVEYEADQEARRLHELHLEEMLKMPARPKPVPYTPTAKKPEPTLAELRAEEAALKQELADLNAELAPIRAIQPKKRTPLEKNNAINLKNRINDITAKLAALTTQIDPLQKAEDASLAAEAARQAQIAAAQLQARRNALTGLANAANATVKGQLTQVTQLVQKLSEITVPPVSGVDKYGPQAALEIPKIQAQADLIRGALDEIDKILPGIAGADESTFTNIEADIDAQIKIANDATAAVSAPEAEFMRLVALANQESTDADKAAAAAAAEALRIQAAAAAAAAKAKADANAAAAKAKADADAAAAKAKAEAAEAARRAEIENPTTLEGAKARLGVKSAELLASLLEPDYVSRRNASIAEYEKAPNSELTIEEFMPPVLEEFKGDLFKTKLTTEDGKYELNICRLKRFADEKYRCAFDGIFEAKKVRGVTNSILEENTVSQSVKLFKNYCNDLCKPPAGKVFITFSGENEFVQDDFIDNLLTGKVPNVPFKPADEPRFSIFALTLTPAKTSEASAFAIFKFFDRQVKPVISGNTPFMLYIELICSNVPGQGDILLSLLRKIARATQCFSVSLRALPHIKVDYPDITFDSIQAATTNVIGKKTLLNYYYGKDFHRLPELDAENPNEDGYYMELNAFSNNNSFSTTQDDRQKIKADIEILSALGAPPRPTGTAGIQGLKALSKTDELLAYNLIKQYALFIIKQRIMAQKSKMPFMPVNGTDEASFILEAFAFLNDWFPELKLDDQYDKAQEARLRLLIDGNGTTKALEQQTAWTRVELDQFATEKGLKYVSNSGAGENLCMFLSITNFLQNNDIENVDLAKTLRAEIIAEQVKNNYGRVLVAGRYAGTEELNAFCALNPDYCVYIVSNTSSNNFSLSVEMVIPSGKTSAFCTRENTIWLIKYGGHWEVLRKD